MSQQPQQFKFVGGTEGSEARTKISWPLDAQAIILKLRKVDGLGAKESFENGRLLYNEMVEAGDIEGQPLPELPASYTNKNAGSVLYGMADRFLKRINKGDSATRAAAERHGLIEPVAQVQEAVSELPEDVDTDDLDV